MALVWVRTVFTDRTSARAMSGPSRSVASSRSTSSSRLLNGSIRPRWIGTLALPPSIVHSKIYRCADNRVIYVDWLSDNKSANIRTEKGGSPTQLTSAEPGGTLTAEGGYEIQGTGEASSARIAVPGHPSQSCKA